jgi:hypothetical protein
MLFTNPGYEGSLPPAGTMLDLINDRSVAPIRYDASVKPTAPTGPMAFQFGGTTIYDPAASGLAKYVYGGNDFPEDSKNVNDPYFSDVTPYPQMQDGGDPTEFTHYTHGQDDVFHDQMTGLIQANDGLEVGDDQYALDYIRQLANQMKGYNKATRQLRRQYNRATGNTMLDYLVPINRAFYPGYTEQQGMPFVYGSNEAYEGEIDPSRFIARDTYKTGRFGPKKFIDYYSVGNEGLNVPDDLSEIEPYTKSKQKAPAQQDVYTEQEDEDISFRQARRNDGVSNIKGAFARMLPESSGREDGERMFPMLRAQDSDRSEDRRLFPMMRADKKQEGGEPNQEDYYNNLFSKLNYSNNYSNYYNELAYKRGGRVLRRAAFGLDRGQP